MINPKIVNPELNNLLAKLPRPQKLFDDPHLHPKLPLKLRMHALLAIPPNPIIKPLLNIHLKPF
jgi:hypothetical protein